jgi:hypothetical protein
LATATEQGPVAAPVQFFTDQETEGMVAPVLLLRWCINREVRDELLNKGIQHPHLLLVIAQDGKERRRYVVPLTDELKYITFDRPGENVVHAAIVWPREGMDAADFRAMIRTTNAPVFGRKYWPEEISLIEDPGPREAIWRNQAGDQPVVILGLPEAADQDERYYYRIEGSETRIPADEVEFAPRIVREGAHFHRLSGETVETFAVDADLFAKPPSQRLKSFVGYFPWGRKRPEDQCDFRGQAIMSFLAAPFVALYWVFIRAPIGLVAGLWLMLAGFQGVDLRPVFHPVTERLDSVWRFRQSYSRWVCKDSLSLRGGNYMRDLQHPVFWIVNPMVLFLALVPLALTNLFVGFWPWWAVAAVGIGGPLALGAVILIVALLVLALPFLATPIRWLWSPVGNWRQRRRQTASAKENQSRLEELERERELVRRLACDQEPRQARVGAARGTKAIPLVATKAKTYVCKPFAR